MKSLPLRAQVLHIGILTGGILGVWSFIAGLVEGLSGFVDPNTFDASQALGPLPGLFVTSLLYTLVLTWYANRTQLSGAKLGVVVFLVIFGVMFFMTQIETLYFLDSIQIPWQIIFGQVLAGIGVGLVAALLTIRYKRKLDVLQSNPKEGYRSLPRSTIIGRFTILAFVYTLFYYLFGYFIAWQFPALREYYSGSTQLVPLLPHMLGQISGEPQLILYQIFRGFLWAGIAYMAAMNMPKAKGWERVVVVGLAMSIGVSFPLLLPQDFMPAPVRLGHFFELFIENFVFGVVVVFLFRHGKEAGSSASPLDPQQASHVEDAE
ncbi:MAG: hypothetical protein E4G99_12910 [Anaerolineales bacterium]|nr:MAG: hypothetical protein E4G99_12910 [Anaerolineales bacterium]